MLIEGSRIENGPLIHGTPAAAMTGMACSTCNSPIRFHRPRVCASHRPHGVRLAQPSPLTRPSQRTQTPRSEVDTQRQTAPGRYGRTIVARHGGLLVTRADYLPLLDAAFFVAFLVGALVAALGTGDLTTTFFTALVNFVAGDLPAAFLAGALTALVGARFVGAFFASALVAAFLAGALVTFLAGAFLATFLAAPATTPRFTAGPSDGRRCAPETTALNRAPGRNAGTDVGFTFTVSPAAGRQKPHLRPTVPEAGRDRPQDTRAGDTPNRRGQPSRRCR